MAQYFYDFGSVEPFKLENNYEFSDFIVKAGDDRTDFEMLSADTIFDYLRNKKCLQLNPINNAGVAADNNSKTQIRFLLKQKVRDFEALISGRASRMAQWGQISDYSGGFGFAFRLPSVEYDSTATIDFSKGGVVFTGGNVAHTDLVVARTMRLYSAGYTSSNAATTSGTYLDISAESSRHRYFFNLRIKVVGNNIKVKSWMSDVTEPTTWGIDYNTTSLPSEGYIGLALSSWIEGRVVDSLAIGTNGDLPPSSPVLYNIAGTLLNPDNSLAANKKVRLYDKKTGCLIDESITDSLGSYGFSKPISPNDLVQIVGVDQDNNEWKPPIHEAYPVL
ncbi:hypothetical protein [Acinetobacter sp. YH12251]|uniref:hypothetical protein n=1 Tax=Acinetobacter sp. YH12251 TaxID=2601176 RepID=UPI0015D20241|nr:hypothetical protein [Acinetobacter sp. YH12251]